MRKIFLFVAAIILSLRMSAATFLFDSSASVSQEVEDVLIELAQGNGTSAPAYSDYSSEMRLYAQNTITIVAEQITSVQLVFSCNADNNKVYASLSSNPAGLVSGGTSTGNKDWKIDTWTGSSDIVVFTLGNESKGQRIIRQVVVNGDPIVIDPEVPEVYIDDTPLDPEFVYGEPTTILCPEKLFSKKEYAFIDNNIRVHCTQGAIIDTVSTPYFNCHEANTLSFKATQPIKAIVINGYVRKQFKASVDNGTIEYCSPGALEEDREGYPVVIITEINSDSVTISCEKQLRCYSVYVYFEANPDTELDCGGSSSTGETFFLEFDTADAVYESEENESPNYTIFLYNQVSPDYPYIALDINPTTKESIEGMYNIEDGTLDAYTWYQYGEGENEFTWMYDDGAVVINKEGDNYSISGFITCDDNNTYNITFNGPVAFYTHDNYPGYSTEGLEDIPALKINVPMYDLFGRKVNDTYRGIVIQEGHKYLLK